MKKIVLTLFGGFLVLMGLVFIVIPGPSLPLIVAGLFLLSFEYHWARGWLKVAQRKMSQAARWIDSKLLNRRLKKAAR